MNGKHIIGAGLLALVFSVGGIYIVMQNTRGVNQPSAAPAPAASTPARAAPAAPVQTAKYDPADLAPKLNVGPGPGPLVQTSAPVFRAFKCVNQRTNTTVFELARARNAEFMGQRNNRAFWKVDTPSRTVTFNTDVRDVNCAFSR